MVDKINCLICQRCFGTIGMIGPSGCYCEIPLTALDKSKQIENDPNNTKTDLEFDNSPVCREANALTLAGLISKDFGLTSVVVTSQINNPYRRISIEGLLSEEQYNNYIKGLSHNQVT